MKRTTITRPSPEDVPPEETARVVANGVAQIDLDRAAAYAGLGTLRTAKATSFAREEKLLARKYGANHPRVAAVAERRASNAVFQRDLTVAHSLATTPAPAVDAGSYVFHGFVRDCDRKPLARLSVALYDANGKWIASLGYGCTDERGYFILRGAPAPQSGRAGGTAEIRVHDAERKLVHREAGAVTPAAGAIDYREIVICDDGTCVPPPDVPDEPPPTPVKVPDVIGRTEAEAKAVLQKAGLKTETSTRETTPDNVGRVLEQTPAAGTEAALGSVVKIVVGVPMATIAVPNVTGVSLREARVLIGKAELVIGKVEPADAQLQAKVIGQSPAAGARVERGSTVDLVVEKPVVMIQVPRVLDLTLAEARKILVKVGLTVGTIKPSGASESSIVVEQSPGPNASVAAGTPVHLGVKEVTPKVTVPSVIDAKLSAATKVLEKAKLKVGRITPPLTAKDGIVLKQSPTAGTAVDEGSAVDLEVRATPSPAKNQQRRKS